MNSSFVLASKLCDERISYFEIDLAGAELMSEALSEIRRIAVFTVMLLLVLISLSRLSLAESKENNAVNQEKSPEASSETLGVATFAGGCFWCMEPPFDELEGVVETIVGYTGGQTENPTYSAISTGSTGHVEAIQIRFRPEQVSFEELLETFWRNIDPTQADGQFADRGSQYETVIFFHNDEQKAAAEKSKAQLQASGKFKKDIVTRIEKASQFYRAERGHQDYYKKNSVHYNLYKVGSGRAGFIESTWDEKK